jgi:hypothetical protein
MKFEHRLTNRRDGMSDDIESLKENEKEKMAFTQDEFALDHPDGEKCDHPNHWVGGLVLIAIGLLFLSNTFGFSLGISFANWWALFILIPGVTNLGRSMSYYQRDGRFSGRTRHAFVWGLILTVVASTFLFNWSWNLVWPVFLIIFGLGAVLTGVLGER